MRLGAIVATAIPRVMSGRVSPWAQVGPTAAYDIAAVYGRLTDSTRITFTLREGSKPPQPGAGTAPTLRRGRTSAPRRSRSDEKEQR